MKHKKPSTGLYKILFLLIAVVFSFCLLGCSSSDKNTSSSTENSSEISSISSENEEKEQETVEEPKEPVVRQALLSFTGDLMVHSYQYEESYDSATAVSYTHLKLHTLTSVMNYVRNTKEDFLSHTNNN